MVGLQMNSFLPIICFTSAAIFIGVLGDSTSTAKLEEKKYIECKDGFQECELTCYDPNFKICNKDNVVTCISGLLECGSGCYNETAGESCKGGVICKKNEKFCGSSCYNLKDQVCFGNIICPKGNELCGSDQCYNPKDENCHKVPVVCPKDTKPCGVKCYIPKRENCFPGGVVCKSKDDKACGDLCYSPKTHSCINNDIKENVGNAAVATPGIAKGKYFSWPIYLLICTSVFLK